MFWLVYVASPAISLAVLIAGLALVGRRPAWLAAVGLVPAAVAVGLLVWMLTTQEQTLLPTLVLPLVLFLVICAALWASLSHHRKRRRSPLALLGLLLPMALVVLTVEAFRMMPPGPYSFGRTGISDVLGYRGHVYALVPSQERQLALRWGKQPVPSDMTSVAGVSDLDIASGGTYQRDGTVAGYVISGHPNCIASTAWGGPFVFYEVYRLVPHARISGGD